MNASEIAKRDEVLGFMEMAFPRWQGEIELVRHKVACPDYVSCNQRATFREWMIQLAEASKLTGVDWSSEEIRASYFEGQPEAWIRSYDYGDTPAEAIENDMDAWDA